MLQTKECAGSLCHKKSHQISKSDGGNMQAKQTPNKRVAGAAGLHQQPHIATSAGLEIEASLSAFVTL
jgi:hypothetical protein